ncbi:hypothetical protein CISIN_1g047022mg [Citrus sinensis]|uniref:Cyclopropane-fatty-acyl-phospholipid synthase n=1 Tax=Citrus sinensis TaxID=2711 RepID=A0A067D9A2_CITSI|nr:hypothetical protein CISIN_1g047022mg [Citrus sinensis]
MFIESAFWIHSFLEESGIIYTFEGARKNCTLKTILRIHNPHFYWNVMIEADLGLADSYINGDFSFVHKYEGLLNLFPIVIANQDLDSSTSKLKKSWGPSQNTSWLKPKKTKKYFFRHISRKNTLTQARRHVSRLYDPSNELFFFLFLDKSMTYSCAIFKSKHEDLEVGQIRKVSVLIEKVKLVKGQEVLEIGCGWGTLAIEIVRQTGCKYTGITLSELQLKYAEIKVKEAGLQDTSDYIFVITVNCLKPTNMTELFLGNFSTVFICGMIEAVGHDYMEELFSCCESLLAENGLSCSTVPDQCYDEHSLGPGFIKEYIFPSGCLPSLRRVTSAMTSSSRLCVEHLENIETHYYQKLRRWRQKFREKHSEILALGFNEKFVRT